MFCVDYGQRGRSRARPEDNREVKADEVCNSLESEVNAVFLPFRISSGNQKLLHVRQTLVETHATGEGVRRESSFITGSVALSCVSMVQLVLSRRSLLETVTRWLLSPAKYGVSAFLLWQTDCISCRRLPQVDHVSDATHVARRILGRMSKREIRIKVHPPATPFVMQFA